MKSTIVLIALLAVVCLPAVAMDLDPSSMKKTPDSVQAVPYPRPTPMALPDHVTFKAGLHAPWDFVVAVFANFSNKVESPISMAWQEVWGKGSISYRTACVCSCLLIWFLLDRVNGSRKKNQQGTVNAGAPSGETQ